MGGRYSLDFKTWTRTESEAARVQSLETAASAAIEAQQLPADFVRCPDFTKIGKIDIPVKK
jgi:hypothetical protein